MKVTVEDVNDTRKKVHVSLNADEIAAEAKTLLKQFSQSAKLPGFRPGKAPENLIKGKYKNELKGELNRKLTSTAYEHGVKESGLDVFAVVAMDGGDVEPGAPGAELSFTFDIRPTFELPEYKGVAVSVPKMEVTEEEFVQTKDYILNQRAEYNIAEKAAEKGDYVKVSYEGKIGDERIAELVEDKPIYGTQTNTWEQAGDDQSPGVQSVVQGLLGMSVGEKKDVEEVFPEDFEVEALRGKTATYSLEVHEVREKKVPEMDEEFLKTFEVETVEQWEERIKQDIRRQKEQHVTGQKRQQLLDHLMGQIEMPLPESAVESEREHILRQHVTQAMEQGASEEQLEEHKETLFGQAGEAALKRVKTQLILGRIAEVEKIKVENEDMQRAIMNQAMQSRTPPDNIVKELQKDQDKLRDLQRAVLFEKTLDFLIDAANVTEVEAEATPAEV
ncbi:trigger factor [Cerasicoccus arenae]|uniref:Trigger factor n=1 Tax=Cerasicoccus arenae TaxID=424488 RepID=A0A8J3DJ23_9BACT|nr:trigger factor [Cerasicoccus arenae]MBK1856662.1 trigger factor [Cerasicoccus arenae]GHB98754.1 trigger factor [Cerasicoccus arenae]